MNGDTEPVKEGEQQQNGLDPVKQHEKGTINGEHEKVIPEPAAMNGTDSGTDTAINGTDDKHETNTDINGKEDNKQETDIKNGAPTDETKPAGHTTQPGDTTQQQTSLRNNQDQITEKTGHTSPTQQESSPTTKDQITTTIHETEPGSTQLSNTSNILLQPQLPKSLPANVTTDGTVDVDMTTRCGGALCNGHTTIEIAQYIPCACCKKKMVFNACSFSISIKEEVLCCECIGVKVNDLRREIADKNVAGNFSIAVCPLCYAGKHLHCLRCS
jgi:hypothetical protein